MKIICDRLALFMNESEIWRALDEPVVSDKA
jgi:hypothetical protein